MSEYLWIYLIEKLDTMHSLFVGLAFISVILIMVFIVINEVYKINFFQKYKHAKKLIWLCPLFATLSVLIPTTNEAYKIIGLGTLVKYSNNIESFIEKEKEVIPNDLTDYFNLMIEQLTKEGSKKNDNTK